MNAEAKHLRRREQRINLLSTPRSRKVGAPAPANRILAVAVVAVLSWAVAAVGLAMLFGWHPGIGAGP